MLGFFLCIPVYLLAVNFIGLDRTYIERSCYVALPFLFMILARGVMPETQSSLSKLLFAGLVIVVGISTIEFFRHPNACAVAACKPDYRSAAKFLANDIGNSRNKAATVSILWDRSLPYYDSGFADRIRLQRLNQHLPRMLMMIQRVLGSDSQIIDSFRKEIAEVQKEEEQNASKTAVLAFGEISREDSVKYDTLYALETPRTARRSKGLLQWIRRRDYQLLGEESFPALHIYKFQRKDTIYNNGGTSTSAVQKKLEERNIGAIARR